MRTEHERERQMFQQQLWQRDRAADELGSTHRRAVAMHSQNVERVTQQHSVELRLLQDQHLLQLKVADGKAAAAFGRIARLERDREVRLSEKDEFIQQL
jgi:hypothetical protein